ncbi:hypothetical protein K456DRAFT_1092089 [Colletotrichum gloeosporioides 23]|nr:hypothetical protein K456DRAFT_1092089 [Colletotrichum gloeosporioides 23]
MFQRIKGAIDRTIAEEQARQEQARKALGPDSGTPRRSDSTSRGNQSPARRPRPKKNVSQDNTKDGDSPSNPDPAVFEAAFVLDDSEEPSRAGTPKPPTMEDKTDEKKEKVEEAGQNGDEKKEGDAGAATAAPAAAPELSPEVRTKLRKLEKLEKTYPELLRSYRIAHGRATSIEPFERVLKEHTSVGSIREPDALVEYLDSLKQKEQMIMDEYKRVSVEKDEFKKKFEAAEKEVETLKKEVEELKAAKPEPAADKAETKEQVDAATDTKDDGSVKSPDPNAAKSPLQQALGIFSPKQKPQEPEAGKDKPDDAGDFFSYDEEAPKYEADVAAKEEEIEKLKTEVTSLKTELASAKNCAMRLPSRTPSRPNSTPGTLRSRR